jgi:hypothetical protein
VTRKYNLNKNYPEKELFQEPDGWEYGIAFYLGLIREELEQPDADDYGLIFVEYDIQSKTNIYVKGVRDKLIYKTLKYFETQIYCLKINLKMFGCFPMNPPNEYIQWKYFLVLPRSKRNDKRL